MNKDQLSETLVEISSDISTKMKKLGFSKEMIDLLMISKIAEESGESLQSYFGLIGSNPRKGKTCELDEVLDELLDVAATSLVAVEHFTGNNNLSLKMLLDKVEKIKKRNIENL